MKKIRDTWVQEFNAGHADKVAALYAQEAVLMRRNGSVHNRDSILAELQRSITAEARNYTVHSLHTEHSRDLGYDTGIYNENIRDHLAEGNYLIVVKRIEGEWKIVAHAAVPNPNRSSENRRDASTVSASTFRLDGVSGSLAVSLRDSRVRSVSNHARRFHSGDFHPGAVRERRQAIFHVR